MFAKGTQDRANKSRQLRMAAANVIKRYGPTIHSAPQFERVRVAFAHGKRGLSKAASAAETRQRTASPKGKVSSPPAKRLALRSRPRTPEERAGTVLILVSAPGVPADVIQPVVPKRIRPSTRSPVGKRSNQAALVVVRAASPSMTPDEQDSLDMRGPKQVLERGR